MARNQFDTITRRLATVASRRHILGGLGVTAVGALVGREAAAAPSPVSACMKSCNSDAKAARKACKSNKSKAKNGCLKTAKGEQAACRDLCLAGGV